MVEPLLLFLLFIGSHKNAGYVLQLLHVHTVELCKGTMRRNFHIADRFRQDKILISVMKSPPLVMKGKIDPISNKSSI